MKLYSWINVDKTEILKTITVDFSGKIVLVEEGLLKTSDPGGVMISIDGIKNCFHSEEIILGSGALLHIYPVLAQYERRGALKIEANRISKEIIDWSPEEIAADVAKIEQEEIRQLKLDSPYLLALVGKDNAWIDNKIDNNLPYTGNVTLDGAIDNERDLHKEQAYASRDIADLFAALHKLNRI